MHMHMHTCTCTCSCTCTCIIAAHMHIYPSDARAVRGRRGRAHHLGPPPDGQRRRRARAAAWSYCSLGRASARLLCLLRARLAALGSLALSDRGRFTERPATASRFELVASKGPDSTAFDHSGAALRSGRAPRLRWRGWCSRRRGRGKRRGGRGGPLRRGVLGRGRERLVTATTYMCN